MKPSDMLKSVLCDPKGEPSFLGSHMDLRIIAEAIKQVEFLEERYHRSLTDDWRPRAEYRVTGDGNEPT